MAQSLSRSDTDFLIRELTKELDAKPDGAGKNLIARCPCCGKEGKYGIYIGKQTVRKKAVHVALLQLRILDVLSGSIAGLPGQTGLDGGSHDRS